MAETVVLRETIARGEPIATGADETADAIAVPAWERRALPFVGREAEVDRLLEAWRDADRGRGDLFLPQHGDLAAARAHIAALPTRRDEGRERVEATLALDRGPGPPCDRRGVRRS